MQELDLFRKKGALRSLAAASPKPSQARLKSAFLASITQSCGNVPKAAILFSGGLDSGLIAKAVAGKVKHTELFTAGFPDSTALSESKKAAQQLHLPLHQAILTEKKLQAAIPKVSAIIQDSSFLQLQIALPLYFAMQSAHNRQFTHIFSGQGADELFLGYNEFRLLLQTKPPTAAKHLSIQKLESMWEENLSRDFALAKHFSLSLHAPFLSPDFIQQALSFPAKENLHGPKDALRKHVLRSLALELSLPSEIAMRKKRAVQYDSGTSKRLKKILKK